jgi:hypothetical protein
MAYLATGFFTLVAGVFLISLFSWIQTLCDCDDESSCELLVQRKGSSHAISTRIAFVAQASSKSS